MREFDEQELAAGYIAFARASEDSPEYKTNFWAFDTFSELCLEKPSQAWATILAVLARDPGSRVIQILAAGPMEELIVNHGEQMIEQVKLRAKR